MTALAGTRKRDGVLTLSRMLVLCGLALVAACGEREVILSGERLPVRADAAQGAGAPNRTQPAGLGAPQRNADWPQRGGSAAHTIRHAALAASPALAWSSTIGAGNDRRHRIAADPVAAGGRIFTLDSRATVVATGAGGAPLWQADLTPAGERADDASGGGLAVAGGTLYAATGFGEVVALDAVSGVLRWRQRIEAPAAGAPTLAGGLVYVTTRDNRGWAINADSGRMAWQVEGDPDVTGVVGGAGPAVAGGLAIFPFSSGQLVATYPKGGFTSWTASAAGSRIGRVYGEITDITGDPVISGNTVYVGNPTGRTVALALDTGLERWAAAEGASGPVIVEGGSVYLVSDRAQLVRLSAADGRRIWARDLPGLVPTGRANRARDIYPHYGPVLAGGRLWVAGGDGVLRAFAPADGALAGSVALGAPAASRPIVANGTLYVVTAAGALLALR